MGGGVRGEFASAAVKRRWGGRSHVASHLLARTKRPIANQAQIRAGGSSGGRFTVEPREKLGCCLVRRGGGAVPAEGVKGVTRDQPAHSVTAMLRANTDNC